MLGKQILRAASGWLELGLPEDALEELRGLSKEDGETKRALELKLRAQMACCEWKAGAATGLLLCEMAADEPEYFLSAAYCLHEAGETSAAKDVLESGPEVLEEIALFHYNMACYHCMLGEYEKAERSLERSFSMDESFQEMAKVDKDLSGMMV